MNNNNKLDDKGMIITSIGGLCTILSLTVIEVGAWKIAVAIIGVLLAAIGIIVMAKQNN